MSGGGYPASIAAIEQSKDIIEIFVTGAFYDFYDIIDECRLDEKIAEKLLFHGLVIAVCGILIYSNPCFF
ncbi:hypothetical protein EDD59_1142 [Muricomes intestini]|uniref:Uncharacterized protein n=1 Tax=Muricomes intestini TaxID=1796634 RepID=A0A4R3K565_9FIRM|nr:hypothetical protein EDD59_1142 [Muricomes intestini]